jgi:hypothetical protein
MVAIIAQNGKLCKSKLLMLLSTTILMKKAPEKTVKKKASKKRSFWKSPKQLSTVSAGLLLAITGGLFVRLEFFDKKESHSVQSLMQACPQDDQACQKKYYVDIYTNEGLEAAFQSLRAEYESQSSVKANCHQITHVIGRAAAQKHQNVAAAYEKGDEFCWSGYYHGVMEGLLQKMGNKDVRQNLNNVCESLKAAEMYSFKHYNCVHGLGHGIMLIEGNELFVSLEVCDILTDEWERTSCHGGVFMENVMAHINPDHGTKYLKNDDPLYPCTAVKEKYAEQCYLMQTSHSLMVLGNDFGKVFELCGTLAEKHQVTCYTSVGRDASGHSISQPGQTHATCLLGPTEQAREGCVIGAVKDFVSHYHGTQEASVFCDLFYDPIKTTCHQTKDTYSTVL